MRNVNIIRVFLYVITIFLSFGLANLVVFDKFWMDGKAYPSLLIVSILATLFSYFTTQQRSIDARTQIAQLVYKISEFVFVLIFIVLIYWFLVNGKYYKKEEIALFFSISFVMIFLANKLFINYLRNSRIETSSQNAIIIGEGSFSKQFSRAIKENQWLGFQLVKKPPHVEDEMFAEFVEKKKIKHIFIDWDTFSFNRETEKKLRNISENQLVKCYAFSGIIGNRMLPGDVQLVGNFPYFSIFQYPLDKSANQVAKRLFDIFFSLGVFVFLFSWLFPILMIAIVIDSGFPIFFSQKRHGIDNKVFSCHKFRSMVPNKQSNSAITIKGDARITKLGHIIRKTSIDELPQFWNVLKGEMSIVGPRPHMVNQNKKYDSLISKYSLRHYVKPGVTGLSQTTGLRGEIKTDKDMERRVSTDIYYIRNWSFGLDISIIFHTVRNIIIGDEKAI